MVRLNSSSCIRYFQCKVRVFYEESLEESENSSLVVRKFQIGARLNFIAGVNDFIKIIQHLWDIVRSWHMGAYDLFNLDKYHSVDRR